MELFQTNSNNQQINLSIHNSYKLQHHLFLLSLDYDSLEQKTKELFDESPCIESYSFSHISTLDAYANIKAPTKESHFEQIPFQLMSQRYQTLAEEIFKGLDSEGFLQSEEKKELKNTWGQDFEEVLLKIQTHTHLGYQNRLEFWQAHLEKKGSHPHVIELLYSFGRELMVGDFAAILKKLKLTHEEFERNYLKVLRSLPLAPRQFEQNLYSHKKFDAQIIFLNESIDIDMQDPLPAFVLSKDIHSQHPDVKQFYKEHLETLTIHIEGIKKRQSTLKQVLEKLCELQFEYLSGQISTPRALHPKDLAKQLGLHLSTLSRCLKDKTILCPHGIVKLKDLATPSPLEEDKKTLLLRLKELIKKEDKKAPYSDQKLLELLRIKGSTLSRRTLTKYRNKLKIPDARRRFFS
jgi:RNA polymerase sigma-54 factor